LGVFVGFEMMKFLASTYLGMGRSDFRAFRSNGPVALIEQLLMIQAVGPTGNATTFNAPAWSISAEFYTYLIFGVVVLLFKERKYVVFSAVGAISLVLLLFDDTFGFGMLLQCFSGFFIGCITFFMSKRIKSRLPSWTTLLVVVMTVLFLLIKTPYEYDAVIFALACVLILSILPFHGLNIRFEKFPESLLREYGTARCGRGCFSWFESRRSAASGDGADQSSSLPLSSTTVTWSYSSCFSSQYRCSW
jgi:peptidoglycan/LPS O-acetylase OafA/YrhL